MQTNIFVDKRQPLYELVHSIETRAPKWLFINVPKRGRGECVGGPCLMNTEDVFSFLFSSSYILALSY